MEIGPATCFVWLLACLGMAAKIVAFMQTVSEIPSLIRNLGMETKMAETLMREFLPADDGRE
nr:hypothetical protein [Marinicella sp. W31]MDC2879758.1 hypothetical protein [Marinicella sp. W31]